MHEISVHLDPRVGALEALGIDHVEKLLDPKQEPGPRAEPLSPQGTRTRMRFPLPGTPLFEGGPLTEQPRGVGTGWVLLERWTRPALGPAFRARLTHPRSLSLGERAWNLYCHLRAGGVGTPEPLAVGSARRGFLLRDSFLITREIEGYLSLPDFLLEARGGERKRGLRAVAWMLAKLIHCRVELPLLAPEQIMVSAPKTPAESLCDLKANLPPPGAGPGIKLNRTPSAILTEVEEGRIRPRQEAAEIAAIFARLSGVECTQRERLELLRLALAHVARPLRKAIEAQLRAVGLLERR